jgi:hypothetical protein
MPKIIYEAYHGGTDGRDCGSLGLYETRALAEKAVKGQGTMGYGDGSIYERKVHTQQDEIDAANKARLKKQALAKLSPDERRALLDE